MHYESYLWFRGKLWWKWDDSYRLRWEMMSHSHYPGYILPGRISHIQIIQSFFKLKFHGRTRVFVDGRADSSWFDATWSQAIRIRRFGPFFLFEMDQTCVFDENWSCDQNFRRKSQWTKLVTACICCQVMEEEVDQTLDPRVLPSESMNQSIGSNRTTRTWSTPYVE